MALLAETVFRLATLLTIIREVLAQDGPLSLVLIQEQKGFAGNVALHPIFAGRICSLAIVSWT